MNEQTNNLSICFDRIIPNDQNRIVNMIHQANVAAALQGTDFKSPRELFIDLDPNQVSFMDLDPNQIVPPAQMALLTLKKWPIGHTLKCRFLGGSEVQQDKTIKMASKWMDHANIDITFVDTPNEDIRIAFIRGQGSWSTIGIDALQTSFFPKNQPTMNFGWLDETTDDTEWRRVVIHEFGHALGCIHEHQSPNENLKWDREAVYRYFSGPPNCWDKETIDFNILEKYSPNGTSATFFDPNSIMLYMFPAELFLDHKPTNNNTDLSDMDKWFIQQMYP
jgi:hypothetical protein